ncbi:hypothetical protein OROMI_023687 [Orobanche minor]
MDSTISSLDEKLKTSSKKRKIEGDDEFNSDAPTPAKKYLVNTTATITAPCKLVPKRFDAGKSKSVPVASKSEVSLNSCMSPVHYGSSIEKIEGDLFGKNDRADRHIDRIFSSYNQRRKNEFNDFMKPEDAKFETRTSLNKLSLLNGKLQPHHKKYIEEMGLLSITKIEFEHLDRELVRWLEERYNPYESRITFENLCSIHISESEASRALGIPHVGDDIYLDLDGVDGINKYRSYFTVSSGRIDINELARKLENCITSGDEFKVCYLMFVFGTLLFPDTQPNIRVGYLNTVVNLEKVPYMNWAKLVVEKLNDGVKSRKQHGRTYLTGCSFLLQVIFLAHICPKGSIPCVNLSSPLPYVEQLTREKISNITFEFNNARGYWNQKARAANETRNNSWLDKDATQISVFPNKEKDRSRIEADEHITNEKKSKEQDFDCPVMGVDHDDVVSPPMHSWGFADGYASTDTSSEDEQQKKCDARTNNEYAQFKFNGDSPSVPKVPVTLEARVSALETLWSQLSQILNPKPIGQSILLTGNSTGLNDHLLSQQIKLIQELKDYMSEMPKIMKSTIRCVMSEFVPKKHQSGSTRRKNKGIIHPVLLSDYVNSEDDVENNNILRCNPTSTEEEIVQFLFDETLPHSTKVIDYGGYHLSREDLKTLSSKCKIKGTVIDVVAYVCTVNERARTSFAPDWFFPSTMTRYILDGKKDDDKLLDWYFKGDGSFTNSVEHLERVHFPIHDQQDHWFLAIVDFNLNVIEVCDTAPDHSKKEHRRNLIQRVVQRFDNLMHKYAGKNYKVKDAKNFLYEDVSWVPRQNNGCVRLWLICLLDNDIRKRSPMH